MTKASGIAGKIGLNILYMGAEDDCVILFDVCPWAVGGVGLPIAVSKIDVVVKDLNKKYINIFTMVLPLVSCWWCCCSMDNNEAVAWQQQRRWSLTAAVAAAAAAAAVAAMED
jgi:hypothetical protein